MDGKRATAKTFLTTKAEFNQAERTYLQQKGQLVACVNAMRMPIESFRGYNHAGMTSDYLAVLSDTLKIPITPVASNSWREIRANVATGRCDLVSVVVDTSQESHELVFSQPYFKERLALATGIDAGFLRA